MRFLNDSQRIESRMIVAAAGMHLEVITTDFPPGAKVLCEGGVIKDIRHNMSEYL